MAHLLTGFRLLVVAPSAIVFADTAGGGSYLPALFVATAIATDYYDGFVAGIRGPASSAGQLFDHTSDFLFVTGSLAGAAAARAMPPVLPILIAIAFTQYVLDSYFLHRRKRLRMSRLGRWNGILYFVPLVVLALARLPPMPAGAREALTTLAVVVGWALVLSTLASIADRALAAATVSSPE
jgi:phosphatidylglycerophosphate synthase